MICGFSVESHNLQSVCASAMSTKVVTPLSREGEQFCPVCEKPAKQRCSACKTVYYCTKEHQKLDWKNHLKNCCAFKLAEDSTVGRHYIATRDIAAGELVLREEKPLIEVPDIITVPVCLNCYDVLCVRNAKPCDKCGWPLCLSCTEHGSECKATMKYLKKKVTVDQTHFLKIDQMYNAVIVLKALALRDTNPKAYQKFLSLEDHSDCTEKMELVPHFGSPRHAAIFVKHIMQMEDIEEDEIVKIIGIVMALMCLLGKHLMIEVEKKKKLQSRTFDIASSFSPFFTKSCLQRSIVERLWLPRRGNLANGENNEEAMCKVNGHAVETPNSHTAVFDSASYFEHNCRANCSNSSTNDGGIIIRTVVPILKGEHISISYINPRWGVVKRRNTLAATKFFDCTCKRCSDPTELGTMFNAIKCIEDKCMGYMLPESFLVPKDQYSDFACFKCKVSVPWLSVKKMLERISFKLDRLQEDDVQGYKQFIEQHSKLLHENHFYMFSARLNLAAAIGEYSINHNSSNVSMELLAEKITLCKKLNVLTKILMPGGNRLRGTLLFHMYAALTEYSVNQLPDWAAFTRLTDEANRALVEAYNLLRDEPLTTPEGRMGRQAQILLQKDTNVVTN